MVAAPALEVALAVSVVAVVEVGVGVGLELDVENAARHQPGLVEIGYRNELRRKSLSSNRFRYN